ncbi:hypothetical protein F9278_22050 [Streptomyces phaeolivaceus]|uniref:Uncharacterized protein n=1 Tax=Streptomyces phaeolivaceus TaxID=2653200 RepID=A0A5P8K541_9ACTN|nr:hypothetical protein [Streptomyces phaeolivaceus]QFQ98423.1 hypothetical protein F9278_22050 [Streptomyces phaeolivaceus]
MRTLVVRLCEALLRWTVPDPPSAGAAEPLEPAPPPPPRRPDDIWPFEPYATFVRPYVLSPEELYVHHVHGVHTGHDLEVPA